MSKDFMNIDEAYQDRLERAILALGDLIGEAGSINGVETDEMRRLSAKREGVQLALTYWKSRNW